jgi:hypothetical protein
MIIGTLEVIEPKQMKGKERKIPISVPPQSLCKQLYSLFQAQSSQPRHQKYIFVLIQLFRTETFFHLHHQEY